MNIPLPIPVALGGTGQVTAFGTGVATALTVNVGSAGAPVLFNGAGGTPTSLTLTNATGLPIAGIASLGTGVATLLGQTSSGTAGLVGTTSPTLITPTLGVASATSINKVALTAPATGSTLTILDGKTLTVNNTIVLAGTDAQTYTFPSTSATIARTDALQTFTGVQTFSSGPSFGALPTGAGVASAATASTLVARDSSGNTIVTNLQQGYTSTATATGTTTLTVASNNNQVFTGTLAQTVVLPVVATLTLGTDYVITNQSTLAVTVQSSGPNTIVILQPGQVGTFTSNATSGTGAAVWNFVVQNATYNTRNNDGSNVVEANSFVETGYVHNVIGANAHASSAITFGHTYATAPIVIATYGGDATSATTYGSGSNIVKGPVACKATDVTTTGCNIWWHSSDGTSWSAGNVVFAQFIVIGI